MLKINGGLSAPFKVHRGVRQVCPLSGMLYSLSIEPMLCKVWASIEGLSVKGFNKKHVLSVYADNVIVFVKNQEDIKKNGKYCQRFWNNISYKGKLGKK